MNWAQQVPKGVVEWGYVWAWGSSGSWYVYVWTRSDESSGLNIAA